MTEKYSLHAIVGAGVLAENAKIPEASRFEAKKNDVVAKDLTSIPTIAEATAMLDGFTPPAFKKYPDATPEVRSIHLMRMKPRPWKKVAFADEPLPETKWPVRKTKKTKNHPAGTKIVAPSVVISILQK